MLIANQKLQDNIAEYVLYMWQLEDMIRACNFDIEWLEENLIRQMTNDEASISKAKTWYVSLMKQMRSERITEKGHLSSLREIIGELNLLHNMLLTSMNDEKYKQIHNDAASHINEFREKVPNTNITDIELCLTGLYGKLLLKMRKKEISDQTEESFKHFTLLLAYLAKKYKEMKNGELNFQMN